ncbi:MAG TPA: hypothetical protein VHS96_16115, partial [Bacteroidia bacterium]|nr:hypothetical protein [Bacteroidia bacterium]
MKGNFGKQLLLLGLLMGYRATVMAQSSASGWEALQADNATFKTDIVRTEQAIDLVQAWVADSIAEKDKQRLKGLGGWIAQRTAARFWLK